TLAAGHGVAQLVLHLHAAALHPQDIAALAPAVGRRRRKRDAAIERDQGLVRLVELEQPLAHGLPAVGVLRIDLDRAAGGAQRLLRVLRQGERQQAEELGGARITLRRRANARLPLALVGRVAI